MEVGDSHRISSYSFGPDLSESQEVEMSYTEHSDHVQDGNKYQRPHVTVALLPVL